MASTLRKQSKAVLRLQYQQVLTADLNCMQLCQRRSWRPHQELDACAARSPTHELMAQSLSRRLSTPKIIIRIRCDQPRN